MVGVIGHIFNPTPHDSAQLARHAETAGAAWIGFADAFWWRDVWMSLVRVADATSSIAIGPAMTNAYLRHYFHTVSALATLQEMAPGRVFAGIAAGGSEVTAAAGHARADAARRTAELVTTIRHVAAGGALDEGSGRTLDVTLAEVPIMIAGRGTDMLRTAGALADRVLLWAIPDSDLGRTVDVVMTAAASRPEPPELTWAPLVEHDDSLRTSILHVAVYASLNTRPSIRRQWGLDDDLAGRIRRELVRGGTTAAMSLVPDAALADLVVDGRDPARLAARARSLGVTSLAVPGFTVDSITDHVHWARHVESHL